jgi:hypothetical protein
MRQKAGKKIPQKSADPINIAAEAQIQTYSRFVLIELY